MIQSLNDIYFSVNKYPFKVCKVKMTVPYSKVPVGIVCTITGFDLRYDGFYTYTVDGLSKAPTIGLDPFEENWELHHESKRSVDSIEDIFKTPLVLSSL